MQVRMHRTQGTQKIHRLRQDATPTDQTQGPFLLMAKVAVFVHKSGNVSDYFSGAFKMIMFPGTGQGSIEDVRIRLVCNVSTKCIMFQSSRARIGFIVRTLALTRVGIAQFGCLDIVIWYGGRKDNVETRMRSSQVLLICMRPALFLVAERTFARHGRTLLSQWRGSESV